MSPAPEMSPNLDDAIVALDGFPGRAADVATARAFLEQLNEVRDVPAVTLTRDQAARMEGAYQAGVRVADESGHVLAVSLPVFLQLTAQRGAWADPVGRAFERLGARLSGSRAALLLLAVGWVCFVFELFLPAGQAFALALFAALHARALEVGQQWQNRARMAESALDSLTGSHAEWKWRARSAEARISTAQVERLFTAGGRRAG